MAKHAIGYFVRRSGRCRKFPGTRAYGAANPRYFTKVAILDTGVDATHPDLTGVVTAGYSVIDGSNGLTDENGHGTWLAGIVAARTDNQQGIAGIGYDHVQVMPVKVLSADGLGQDSDIIQGIIWAADNRASVILMAFSNPGFSDALQDAIDYAWAQIPPPTPMRLRSTSTTRTERLRVWMDSRIGRARPT